MAKELPFFKFEPSLWENGNIQLCSFECQGIFINVCSMYWQRLGDLPYKLAVQKICRGNATALDSLIEDDIVKVINGMICIDFLNEQLSEFENTSVKNSQAAHERWRIHRENALALKSQSERNAIREDKIRGEEIREDENGAGKPASLTIDDRSKIFMQKIAVHLEEYPKEMLREFYDYWTESNEGGRKMKFEMQKTFDIQKRLAKWASNQKTKINGTTKNRRESTEELAEAWAKRVKQDFDSGVLSGNQQATS